MSEPEQCIICLDPLPRPSSLSLSASSSASASANANPSASVDGHVDADCDGQVPAAATTALDSDAHAHAHAVIEIEEENSSLNIVAALDGCDHIIHDVCIRSWAQKTNTCPICRNPFHSVKVYNGVDGTAISNYEVQDKKQVAEYDDHQWMVDNPEEEEDQGNPCPICNSAEQEDVLLLCDSCDAAYHTHCIGLDYIPDGDWYCLECAHLFQLSEEPGSVENGEQSPRPQYVRRPNPRDVRGYHVRTRARMRRARRQARNFEWQGAWGQFSGRFFEMSDLDLDNHEEDEDLQQFRRFQALGRRELDRWQQRMEIANRLGASDAFANNIPPAISQQLQPPPPPVETRDERRAWGALDRAREVEDSPSTSRKRKTRSVTASPREPAAQEPERKLKRPRTRRLPTQNGEGSSSVASPAHAGPATSRPPNGSNGLNGFSSRNGVLGREDIDPLLVSSLLKELEPSAMSEDESSAPALVRRFAVDASSPALSPALSPAPSPSAYSSPRALSLTPPPLPPANGRPSSPTTLSLSSHIEPRYPPANYSPTRKGSDHGDPESRPSKPESRPLEIRQPRPRRPAPVPPPRDEHSPTRWTITHEEKRNINDIVKCALRPHWRAHKLTTDQYATINRDISRKLYDEVKGASSLNDEARRSWEQRAAKEVAQAMSEIQA